MKKLLTLLEVVRQQGEILNSTLPLAQFFKEAEQAVPFVFSKTGDTTAIEEEKLIHLDAPFRVFSVEMSGDTFISIPSVNDEIPVSVDCILVIEQEPKKFLTIGLARTFNHRWHVLESPSFGHLVESLLLRLRREATGVEQVRERVKLGLGSDKRVHTFRRVVHVRPKSWGASGLETRNVDWSHRWAVRGHWRVVSGLGKDREGRYCVEGLTWVSEHEKGPEDAPLVTQKPRIVFEEKS